MESVLETIKGNVRGGRGIGRMIGFPTINIKYEGNRSGVFVGSVRMNSEDYKAAVHVGSRPTFFDGEPVCEAYLFDFDGDIEEGTEIEVSILDRVRDVMTFENLDFLKKQISKDVEFIKGWYTARES